MDENKKEVINRSPENKPSFRDILREDVLEGHTPLAKFIDILLLLAILISVVCVLLEAIPSIHDKYFHVLLFAEWVFTLLFTIEYLVRFICAKSQVKYVFSFFGIIDLLSVLPLYLTLIFGTGRIMQLVRLLRLVRVFSRLLRMSQKMDELSQSFLHLRHHLGPNEKIVFFFRPTRKRRLLRYIFIFIFLILSLFDIIFNFIPNSLFYNIPVFFFVSLTVFLFSFIFLLNAEYYIWSERYMISNERIFHSKGIFHEHFQSKTYSYITDVSFHQTIWDKILNMGDLIVHTAGGEKDEMKMIGISKPLKLKQLINENVSQFQSRKSANLTQHTLSQPYSMNAPSHYDGNPQNQNSSRNSFNNSNNYFNNNRENHI